MASASRSAGSIEIALLLGASLLGSACGESKPPDPCAGVDLNTDPSNCGTCGFVCFAGATCTAGTCACPAGESQCGRACVNLDTSAQNCGSCGHVCGLGTCTGGNCICSTGAFDCGGSPACVNRQTDVRNCGSCGNACLLNGICTNGTCGCPAALPDQCPDVSPTACVNKANDAANCGACGRACATGFVCTARACVCPAGKTECSGACVDTKSDQNNCGSCGNRCATGKSCVNSACVCPAGKLDCGGACCDGTLCCPGNACQPAHANGLGQSYFDCSPLGTPGNPATYSLSMAQEAAGAWNASGTSVPTACGGETCLGWRTSSDCAVWCYGSTLAGYVYRNAIASLVCTCPVVGTPNTFTWR
jgi:hypothetical protein